MTLTDIVFVLGLFLVVIAALVLGALVLNAHARPQGRHHVGDDPDYWQRIASMPDRHPAPDRPDGRPA